MLNVICYDLGTFEHSIKQREDWEDCHCHCQHKSFTTSCSVCFEVSTIEPQLKWMIVMMSNHISLIINNLQTQSSHMAISAHQCVPETTLSHSHNKWSNYIPLSKDLSSKIKGLKSTLTEQFVSCCQVTGAVFKFSTYSCGNSCGASVSM